MTSRLRHRTVRRLSALLATTALVAAHAAASEPAATPTAMPTPPPALSAPECEVWMREMSFARAVADHDAAAFAEHLDEQAAFGASRREPQRGRTVIAREWTDIVSGKEGQLEWYPTRVTIAGRSDIAWSSGPTLFEDPTPGAAQRWHIGAFRSVWARGADGVWRVLFDDGAPARPATDEQVAAFRAGRRECTSLTSS
jgi:ketosteroid isomerase-like protein